MKSIQKRVRLWLVALMTVLAFTPAVGQETITYAYDARGRLAAASHCGTVNNGVASKYVYDAADNRANVAVSTGTTVTLTIDPNAVPGGTIGTAYSQTITASGGSGGYSYSITAGSLPIGLSLSSSTGVVSGIPSTAGTYTFTVKATDCATNTGSRSYSLTTSPVSVSLSPTTLPAGAVGTAYSRTITATGGIGGYSYNVSSGSLPAGLSLNSSTGVISGTPQTGNTYTFAITATDSSNKTGSRPYTMVISLGLSPGNLPGGMVGSAYNQTILASGGSGGISYSISAGTLPMGVSLNSLTGVIAGTPSAANSYTFTVKAVDSLNNSGSRSYTVAVKLALSPTSLPGGTAGTAYSQQITASGGSGSYSYTASTGTPPGISLSTAGLLSGIPTSAGTYNFSVTASDTAGHTASRSYSVSIGLSLSPASLPNGNAGMGYVQAITANGGTGSYTYHKTAGTLPPGLGVIDTGSVSGTPTAVGSYTFTVTATDSATNAGNRSYTVVIGLELSPTSLPGGTVGTAYSQQITASGGSGSYSYTVGSGTPPGTSLSSAGLLSGTPTSAGTYNFAVSASDTAGHTGSRPYGIVIGASATCGGVSFSVANTSRTEGFPLIFTVTRAGSSTITCTVNYATSNGTAVAGTDYAATSGTLAFTPSQTSHTVQVNTIDDGEYSKNRSMHLNLSSPSSGATLTNTSATGTIMEADPDPCPRC